MTYHDREFRNNLINTINTLNTETVVSWIDQQSDVQIRLKKERWISKANNKEYQ